MAGTKKCVACGAPVPADVKPPGLCAACIKAAESEIKLPRHDKPSPDSTIRLSLPPLTEESGQQIGRYKLLEQIGEGGMGTIWLAEQLEPVRRKVALKVIKLGMATKPVIARFEAERQALALMDHPHIAKVLDAGVTEIGQPYFVMEYVPGEPLGKYCDRHNLTTRERLEIFVQVCKAIQHAHEKAILHRDIKHHNILVKLNDGRPWPVLIDFGIARALAGQKLTDKTIYTVEGSFIGTPAYMSPEQAEMGPLGIDNRSDIYSLGVVLYELLTGFTPIASERLAEMGPTEMRRVIREEEAQAPSTRLTKLDAKEKETVARRHQCPPPKLIHLVKGDLDRIVMKSLEKDRTHRYASVNDLASDVQKFLKGEPISLTKIGGLASNVRRLVRRHKFALAAGVMIPIVAIVSLLAWPKGSLNIEKMDSDELFSYATNALEHYDQTDKLTEARKCLEEIQRKNGAIKDDSVNAKLGWVYWLMSEENDSDEYRQKAYKLSLDALNSNAKIFEANLVQGLVSKYHHDWSAAISHLTNAVAISRSTEGISLVALAGAYHRADDLTNAYACIKEAHRAAGNRWYVYYRLGMFHQRIDPRPSNLDSARASYQKAVEYGSKEPLAHYQLGAFLNDRNDSATAYEEFKISLRQRKSAATLGAMGSVSLKKNDYEKAYGYFTNAIGMDPKRYEFHLGAGESLVGMAIPGTESQQKEYFEKAGEEAKNKLSSEGENPELRAVRGLCLAYAGKEPDARLEMVKAEQESPDDIKVLNLLIEGYRVLGDPDRAEPILTHLRELRKQR